VPLPVAVQRVVTWSTDSRLLAVDGAADGRIGLFVVDGSGSHRVDIPSDAAGERIGTGAVDIPTALGATFSGDGRFLFLTTGRAVFAYDIESHRLTRMQLPGEAGDLPLFDLIWAPGR
jgi:hypothetical protein